MPPLYRAIPFAEVNGIPLFVRHDLKLNMLWPFNILFHVNVRVGKCSRSLRLNHIEGVYKVIFFSYNSHPPAASACRCLQYYWISYLFCNNGRSEEHTSELQSQSN